MRLALLGLDQTTLALAKAAQASGRDELVLFCDVTEDERAALLSVAIRPQPWELLLTGTAGRLSPCDAVLVSRDSADDERRLEQLRKLVQTPLPMVLSHPVHESMLAYYELDMIRRDTGCLMTPALAARLHPLAVRLHALIQAGEASDLGPVEQLVFERALAGRGKTAVVEQFARDVDLLRFLGGEVSQLGAMGPAGTTAAGEPAAFTHLNVQMAAEQNRVMRWWVVPPDDLNGAKLTVTGQRAKAILTMPSHHGDWRLEVRTGDEPAVYDSPDWDPHAALLDELRSSLNAPHPASRWPVAARAIELAETIDRSLAKGRMIDLYEQEYSSASTFKVIMSGVGCALLLLCLAGMVVGALAANLLKHAGFARAAQIAGAVPYVFLGVFVLFLALQFLLKLTAARPDEPAADAAPRDKRT